MEVEHFKHNLTSESVALGVLRDDLRNSLSESSTA